MKGPIKYGIFMALCLAFCLSCATARLQPVLKDSTVLHFVDSLRIKDSIVFVSIPLESSRQVTFPPDISHLETSVAKSDAWIDQEGRIHHTLDNKNDEKLPAIVPIYERARTSDNVHFLTLTKTVEKEKQLTPFQTFRLKAFWWLAGIVAAAITIIIAKFFINV